MNNASIQSATAANIPQAMSAFSKMLKGSVQPYFQDKDPGYASKGQVLSAEGKRVGAEVKKLGYYMLETGNTLAVIRRVDRTLHNPRYAVVVLSAVDYELLDRVVEDVSRD